MASAFPHQSPPRDSTLTTALVILGVIAALQFTAGIIALAPELGSMAARVQSAPDEIVVPTEAVLPADPVLPDEATIAQANLLLEQADRSRSVGDLQTALESLAGADALVPNEPGILFQMAVVQEELGRRPLALQLLQRLVEIPATQTDPAYADIRQQALLMLSTAAAEAPTSVDPATAMTTSPGTSAPRLRDEVGVPIGSVLGIVDCRLMDGEPGFKSLRIATKADPNESIDSARMNVVVNFYELTDLGEVVQNTEPSMWEWLSPPVDWANSEPELLEVKYKLPDNIVDGVLPVQFYGYIVGIYYNGELQDSRAEPTALLDQFTMELTLPDAVE